MLLRSGRKRREENVVDQPRNLEQSVENEVQPQVQPEVNQPQAQNDRQKQFDALYSDLSQPGAFTSKIRRYLRQNVVHSLHKNKRRNFPRRKIITYYPGNIIQSDLIDMQKYSSSNSGFNFILVVIDCFSQKLWTHLTYCAGQ